jgi:hypothetical protein
MDNLSTHSPAFLHPFIAVLSRANQTAYYTIRRYVRERRS